MVLVQKWPFFQLFLFRQYWPGKCLPRYCRTKKNTILGYKNKKFKRSKNWHFSQVVNQWLWSKNGRFGIFFRQYRPGKSLFNILERQKRYSRLWKQEVQRVEKLTFFPNGLTHVFGPKMATFPTFLFLRDY